MPEYTFFDFVEIDAFQRVMDSFYAMTGLHIAVCDVDANVILASGWLDICGKFHRMHSKSSERCKDSDYYISSRLGKEKCIEHKCGNGLWDMAFPIIIGEQHVATFFFGQFFYDDDQIDMEYFRNQAIECGFDVESYMDALNQVPVFSREDIKSFTNICMCFTDVLINMGEAKLKQIEAEKAATLLANFSLDHSADLMLWVESSGRIVYANKAACRSLGYTYEELTSMHISNISPDLPLNKIDEKLQELKQRKSWTLESMHKRKDGSMFPVEVTTNFIEHNGKEYCCAVIRDITERKRAEEALRESTEMMRLVLDAIPSRVSWKNSDLVYLGCNHLISNDAGLASPEQIIGKSDYDLPWKEHVEDNLNDDRAVIKSGMPKLNCEKLHFTHDGNAIWLRTNKMPLRGNDGQVIGVMNISEDITKHKQAEQELKQHSIRLEQANEELVRKNAELDEFTYVASHDLQEPLRKLTAFSGLLQKDAGDSLSAQSIKDLSFITDAASRMQMLILDLLTLSRAGRKAMRHDLVSLDTCVDDAINALCISISETRAQIKRSELGSVIGDPIMLTQTFQNLIGNAIKFTKDKTPDVRISSKLENGIVTVCVSDNGIGMKPEYFEQIFTPFKRLHGREEYPGTGIGLAICRKTIERHDGKIWVESEFGMGSSFKFTLHSN